MTHETFKDIEQFESDLWEAADNLRANSKLTSSYYFMPVLHTELADLNREAATPAAKIQENFEEPGI